MFEGSHRAPVPGELAAILLAGTTHVVLEVWVTGRAALIFNLVACGLFAVYVAARWYGDRGLPRVFGLRADNLGPAARAGALLVAALSAALLLFALVAGSFTLPDSPVTEVLLYPVWGTAQQFALQNFVIRNLQDLVPRPVPRALIGAALFGLVHAPRMRLVLLTVVAGFVLTQFHRRYQNLWVTGVAHGLLGLVAFATVVGGEI